MRSAKALTPQSLKNRWIRCSALRILTESERNEVVDEVLFQLHVNGNSPTECADGLMRVKLRGRAIDLIRRKSRERKVLGELKNRSQNMQFTGGKDPSAISEAADARTVLFKVMLRSLSPAEYEAIYRRFYGNETFERIAPSMSIATSTAHKLVKDGLTKLRRPLIEFKDLPTETFRSLPPQQPPATLA